MLSDKWEDPEVDDGTCFKISEHRGGIIRNCWYVRRSSMFTITVSGSEIGLTTYYVEKGMLLCNIKSFLKTLIL